MRSLIFCLILTVSLASSALAIDYPPAPRGDVTDKYGGVTVPDPYRWMEDLQSPEVKAWVTAENALTFDYLRKIPNRDVLLARMKSMLSYERWSIPAKSGGRYFFTRNDGLANFAVVCVSDTLDLKNARVLLDPNSWSGDGSVSLQDWRVNEAGDKILYAKSGSGSDWVELHVLDVNSGQDLADVIHWAKFGAGYWADKAGTGFYYKSFPRKEGEEYKASNDNAQTWYHQLGTEQSADTLYYSEPTHPDWWLGTSLSEDYQLGIVYLAEPGTINNRIYIKRHDKPGMPVVKVIDTPDANYGFIGNIGTRLFFQTDKNAPNGKLIEIDLDHPERNNWKVVVGETIYPLNNVTMAGGYFFLDYMKDVHTIVEKYTTDGVRVTRLPLPGYGYASGFGGYAYDTEVFFNYVDYTTPTQNYRYDIVNDKVEKLPSPQFPADLSKYESTLRFYRSSDGMAVPLFILKRRDTPLDGNRPTILYGYGGFGSTMTPYFSSSRLAWLDMGGVYAVAGIRGGSEYGKQWHESAVKQHRQVAFNDFIAAAEYLIDEGYTNSARLAINGGSNGGLLVTAVEVERPGLFAVALPQVPVADMLRFNQFTAGKGWEGDYGSPQVPEEFAALYAYSPYHNVKEGTCYPATLVTTADTDDRVVPAHSFKFAAAMQHAQTCGKPVLLRVETAAGHGAGKPLDKVLEEIADIYGFALENMGVQIPSKLP